MVYTVRGWVLHSILFISVHKKRHFYTITIRIDVYDWKLDSCILDLFFD